MSLVEHRLALGRSADLREGFVLALNKRPRSKLRGIGLPKNAASCGE